jgi:hypothetical protein
VKRGVAAAVLAGALLAPSVAHAEPGEPNYLRAVLEQLLVFGGGLAQYFENLEGNRRDWELDYSWGSLEKKLTGKAISFDANVFDTNWITHSTAGWLYYTSARANRLSIGESLALAAATSTLWELLGEFREQASTNDLLMTPVSGLAIGEPLSQLGAAIDRADLGTGGDALSLLFGTMRKVHEVMDGLPPERENAAARGTHDVRLSLGAGATTQRAAPSRASGDLRLSAFSRVVHAPHHGRAGSAARFLDDGNLSSVGLELTATPSELTDFRFSSQVAPVGWYVHDARESAERALDGHSLFVGPAIGFDYHYHDDHRDDPRGDDRIALVFAGSALDFRAYAGKTRLTATLDAGAVFAGVTPIAQSRWVSAHDGAELPNVARWEGYYHAYGAALAPSLEARFDRLSVSASARMDTFWSFDGLYRVQPPEGAAAPAMRDRRLQAAARLSYRLDCFEIGATARKRVREGNMASVAASTSEWTLGGEVSFVW